MATIFYECGVLWVRSVEPLDREELDKENLKLLAGPLDLDGPWT